MPAISVILPTKNRHRLLQRALESVLRQSFRDFEVLLVDNNPKEQRVAGVAELKGYLDDRRVRLFEYEEGTSAAMVRNRVMPEAQGQYITYLDDDDSYYGTKLERQFALIESSSSPIVTCGFECRIGWRRRYRQHRVDGFEGDALLLDVVPTTQVLFHVNDRRARWDPDLGTVDDACFFQAFVKHYDILRVPNCPEPLVKINIHSEPRINTVPLHLYRGRRRLYVNHARRFSNRARRIFVLHHLLGMGKFERGNWGRFLTIAAALIRRGGRREVRRVFNAVFVKIPFTRRFMIT